MENDPRRVVMIECAGCGATTSAAACGICDTDNEAPADLRRPAPLDAEDSKALKEGRMRVVRVLLNEGGADIPGEPLAVLVGVASGIALAYRVGGGADGSMWLGLGACLCGWLGVSMIGVMLFWQINRRFRGARSQRIDDALEVERRAATCPACDEPVDVPDALVVFECARCEARLLASNGLLAAWPDDLVASFATLEAKARVVAWANARRRGHWIAFALGAFLFTSLVGGLVFAAYRSSGV